MSRLTDVPKALLIATAIGGGSYLADSPQRLQEHFPSISIQDAQKIRKVFSLAAAVSTFIIASLALDGKSKDEEIRALTDQLTPEK